MRFFVHYEGKPEYTFKAKDLPETTTVADLIQEFVTAYNIAKGQNIEASNFNLVSNAKTPLSKRNFVSKIAKDGEDLFIVERDPNGSRTCTHNACGKVYFEKDNTDESCIFHPGVPIFHEGRKGWSCCNKRVDSFDQFLELGGCAVGKHTDAPKDKFSTATLGKKPENVQNASGLKLVSNDSATEVYTSKPTPTPTPKPTVPEVKETEVEEEDPIDAVIQPGTSCKHNGCNAVYKDQSSRKETCTYHPGVAVFHEGSKKWSCCKPRALEFDEFLKIEGCTKGKHKFIPPKKQEDVSDQVKCRIDFYQSSLSVTVNVYGKNVNKDSSKVSFTTDKVFIALQFKDGKRFDKEIILAATIVPEQCKYEVLSTKVEVILRKGEQGQSWTTLSKFGDL